MNRKLKLSTERKSFIFMEENVIHGQIGRNIRFCCPYSDILKIWVSIIETKMDIWSCTS